MSKLKQLHHDLIHYGTYLYDFEFSDNGVPHRERLIEYEGNLYRDYMIAGKVIECRQIEESEI